MPFLHKQLAAGRWFPLTLAEQLGNIGSEVGRTIRADKAGDRERKERALARALELLDLTLADPRRAGEPEQGELRRLLRPSLMSSKGKTLPVPASNPSTAIFWSGG